MRRHSPPFRLSAAVSAAALAFGLAAPAARAQTAAPIAQPPAGAAPAASGAPDADPPTRVGRVSLLSGTVSFHGPGSENWSAATVNYPLSNGDGLWTEPAASATFDVGSSQIALSGGSELEIDTLDAKTLVATQAQGEVFYNLAQLQPGETDTTRTPRGTVTMSVAGKYDIQAGDTEHPTVISVVSGAADVSGEGLSLHVAAGQAATIDGTDSFAGKIGPLGQDPFLTAMIARFAPPATAAAAAPPPAIVASMTGSADLAGAGTWRTDPQYGEVWQPRVAADWRPYRDGRWSYVGPWGWTWVDDAPWGFAPSHYGRWLQIDNAWAWTPGPYAVEGGGYGGFGPVYAPALVSFFGVGAAVGAVALFGGFRSVGWLPLGPGEIYRPWYGHSEGYLRSVNIRNVTNITNITNINRSEDYAAFRNRGAATVAPASVIANSQRIGPRAQGIGAAQLASARPIATGLDHRAEGLRPALRAPGPPIAGARPGAVALRGPGGAGGARPSEARPGMPPGGAVANRESGASGVRPGEPGRGAEPGAARAPEARSEGLANRQPAGLAARPGEAPRGQTPGPRAPEGRPGAEPRTAAGEPARTEPARPAAQAERAPARPAPQAARAPAPQAARAPAPRFAQARPAASRPEPRAAPRPAPRPVQRAAAPRPAPAQHAGGGGGGHRRG